MRTGYVDDHDVLGLDVPVEEFLGVHVVDGGQEVPDDEQRPVLAVPLLPLELGVELPLRAQLHQHVDVVVVVEAPVQLDDVRVAQVRLDLELVDEARQQLLLQDHLLGDDLQGREEPCQLMPV